MEELVGLILLSWVVERQDDIVIFLELGLELITRDDSMKYFMPDPLFKTEISQVVIVEVMRSTFLLCIPTS